MTLPVKQPHPRRLIWDHMRAHGWGVDDLAGAMDGDRLQNRVILSLVFRDRPGTALGPSLCHRIGVALDVPPQRLEVLDRDWSKYRRELSEAGRKLLTGRPVSQF